MQPARAERRGLPLHGFRARRRAAHAPHVDHDHDRAADLLPARRCAAEAESSARWACSRTVLRADSRPRACASCSRRRATSASSPRRSACATKARRADPARAPEASARLDAYAALYREGRPGRELQASRAGSLRNRSFTPGLMVKAGDADAMVAGVATTRRDACIEAGMMTIGLAPGIATPSSFFLMVLGERVLMYADCAVNADPGAGGSSPTSRSRRRKAAGGFCARSRAWRCSRSPPKAARGIRTWTRCVQALEIARRRAPAARDRRRAAGRYGAQCRRSPRER